MMRNRVLNKYLEYFINTGESQKAYELFKNNNIDINHRYKFGLTPLMLASIRGSDFLLETLIENGADVNLRGARFEDVGVYNKFVSKITCFAQKDHGVNALFLAAVFGNYEAIKTLVKNGADFSEIEEMRVKSINKNEKQVASEVLLSNSFSLNKDEKKPLIKVFEYIEKINDYRLNLILTYAALNSLDREGLKIFSTGNKHLFPLKPNKNGFIAKGEYLPFGNVIKISNVNDRSLCAKIIAHELIHFVRLNEYPSKGFPDQDLELKSAVEKVEENIRGMEEGNLKTFIKTEYIDKIYNKNKIYAQQTQVVEEALANIGKFIVFRYENRNEDEISNLDTVMMPLLKYFDKNIIPLMERSIYNHPKRKCLVLGEKIKANLRKQRDHLNIKKLENIVKDKKTEQMELS